MSNEPRNSISDLMFVAIFSILIFFGAFFVFSEFKKPSVKKQVSIRSLERVINKKVNKRIQNLEGQRIFLKSKIKSNSNINSKIKPVEKTEIVDSKYSLDLFEKGDVQEPKVKSQSIYEGVMQEASIDDGNNTEQEKLIQDYKKQLIERARQEGWEIELNDDLEITKQVKLK
jgi:hypothetical protein